jgi:hypothetical protein
MAPEDDPDQSVPALLRDLDSVRKRLDQAHEWLRDGVTSVTAAALAEKTKHICQQASQCDDPVNLQELLAEANECLRDLEKLLGFH